MNRRGIFIGTGAILLLVGAAGLAMLQTGMLDEIVGLGTHPRLEAPSTETLPQPSNQAGQSRIEGKVPTPSDEGISPAPQADTATEKPAEKPSGPPAGIAATPSKPPESAPSSRPKPETAPRIPPVLKGERRFPNQLDLSQPPKTRPKPMAKSAVPGGKAKIGDQNRYTGPQNIPETRQPVTIRFVLDPARSRDLKIARVRLGDRVMVRVRRLGAAERQIYLGFDLPENTRERSYPYYGRVVRKTGTVITTLRDSDQLTLSNDDLFGTALSRKLGSREGAVMKIGAKPLRGDFARTGASFRDGGRYEVEVRIYSGNRWNIRPRSLL